MNGYVQAEVIAERWDISVSKFGNAWAIPEGTQKPTRTGKLKPGRKPKE